MATRIITMFLSVFLLVRCADSSSVDGSSTPADPNTQISQNALPQVLPRAPVNKYAHLAGSYEFAQVVHASEMMPPEVSDVFDEISAFMADPGQALINTILDQAFR